ncbi:MAG TPA: hypothetical protein VGK16_14565 [Candidatus Limnocylindrales bacterium]
MPTLVLKLVLTPLLVGGASVAARAGDRRSGAGSSRCRSRPARSCTSWRWTRALCSRVGPTLALAVIIALSISAIALRRIRHATTGGEPEPLPEPA